MPLLFDHELKLLYARALVSIVRAEGEIGSDEGERLEERVELRCQVGLEDVLLSTALQPETLAAAITGGPFRGTAVRADEVARLLVEDSLYIALGKGSVTSEEAHRMWRYAMALGLSENEFRQLTERWIP